jgi:hypothetical protein
MDVNSYLGKAYENPPCWLLVTDVYLTELADADVLAFKTVDTSVRSIADTFRLALHKEPHGFRRITEPADYAVVLMGRSARLGLHHCGVYYQGSVLHAVEDGVFYQDLASLRDTYPLIEFWAKS